MRHEDIRRWAVSTTITAGITCAAVLGGALPAGASTLPQRPSAATTSVEAGAGRPVGVIGPSSPHGPSAIPASTQQPAQGERSWSSIIKTAIEALKKVPAIWKQVVDGVKKTYSTFKTKVWPAIKSIVGIVSTAISAWDIWNYFN